MKCQRTFATEGCKSYDSRQEDNLFQATKSTLHKHKSYRVTACRRGVHYRLWNARVEHDIRFRGQRSQSWGSQCRASSVQEVYGRLLLDFLLRRLQRQHVLERRAMPDAAGRYPYRRGSAPHDDGPGDGAVEHENYEIEERMRVDESPEPVLLGVNARRDLRVVPRSKSVEEEQQVTHAVDGHDEHVASKNEAHRVGVFQRRHVGPIEQEQRVLQGECREGAEDAVNPKDLPQQGAPGAQEPTFNRRLRMCRRRLSQRGGSGKPPHDIRELREAKRVPLRLLPATDNARPTTSLIFRSGVHERKQHGFDLSLAEAEERRLLEEMPILGNPLRIMAADKH